MLTREQNELVRRTGPGTPQGAVMRRYWISVALSAELAERDGPPVRLKVLGERLVAFRESSGRLGPLDELCAHRCASLFLGRNEQDGLRCVYHGWKYMGTSYYQVRAVGRIPPAAVAWPEALRDAMVPAPVVAS